MTVRELKELVADIPKEFDNLITVFVYDDGVGEEEVTEVTINNDRSALELR